MNTAILKTEQQFSSLEGIVDSGELSKDMAEGGIFGNFFEELNTRLKEFREFLQSA